MKRAVSILLMVVMMAMCVSVSAQTNVKVTLDGNEIFFPDAKPFIDERDRVLVPIRFVSEALGAFVYWENESRTAVIKQDSDEIRYTVYQPMTYLNGEMMVMDTYGILKDCRTMVYIFLPLRLKETTLPVNISHLKELSQISTMVFFILFNSRMVSSLFFTSVNKPLYI